MATVLFDCLRIQDVPLPFKLEEELSQPPLHEIVTKKSKRDAWYTIRFIDAADYSFLILNISFII